MKHNYIWLCAGILAGLSISPAFAQGLSVPRLVQVSGTVKLATGRPTVGITFTLYKDQEGGAPIWMETQNVPLDESGRYNVLLGATVNDGLPTELFASGEARWLGVQPEGQAEQPRVLLLSVPYALKAADAETIGGLPASAFVLAGASAASSSDRTSASFPAPALPGTSPALSGSGTLDFIPLWTPNGSTLGNSIIFQSTSSNIGVGTTTPGAKLDISGSAKVRGTLLLPATGAATSSAGANSQPLNLAASAFNSGTAAAVNQTFSWKAEPAGNNTSSPSGTLNLLFGAGSSTPTETGLHISSGGLFSFAAGQTFPGTGTITGVTAGAGLTGGGTSGNVNLGLLTSCGVNQVLQWNGSTWVCATVGTGGGTITGVTAGTDLTGGGTSGNVTLNLDITKVPQLSAANTFSANQTINANLTVSNFLNGNNITGSTVKVTNGSSTAFTTAVFGESSTSTGETFGVEGINTSSTALAAGVYGETDGIGSETFGVQGLSFSNNGIGVLGTALFKSVSGGLEGCCPIGVWGDTGSNLPGAAGLVGTADDARAIYLQNNSPSGVPTAFMFQGASGKLALVAGGSVGSCSVDTNGNLACNGSKSAVVPVDQGARQVALYAVEAPQNWFEDFGSGRLTNGAVTITLEPTFAQTVNAGDYHVFLTPRGDCEGLYVAAATDAGFEVRELRGGKSQVAFDYRIVALRRGYENVRLADMTQTMARVRDNNPKSLAAHPVRLTPHAQPRVSSKVSR